MASRTNPNSEIQATSDLSAVDALAQFSFVVQDALARRAAEHGVSMILTRLMGVLRDREPTINELAKFLELDKSSVSGLIDRAERRGLVERVRSTADRRAVLVRLTADGRSLASRVAVRFEADISAMLDCLTPKDSDALHLLLSRILVARSASHGFDLGPS